MSLYCMQIEMPYHEQGWKTIQVGQDIALAACHPSNSPYWPASLQARKIQAYAGRAITISANRPSTIHVKKLMADWAEASTGCMKG